MHLRRKKKFGKLYWLLLYFNCLVIQDNNCTVFTYLYTLQNCGGHYGIQGRGIRKVLGFNYFFLEMVKYGLKCP